MSTHTHVLREISKFAAGLITADFLVGVLLFASAGAVPITFFGYSFTTPFILGWMIFDVLLLIILIHYAWYANVHAPSIHQRTLFVVIGTITGLVALLHLLRIMFNISVNIGGLSIPVWLSGIAVIAAAYISYASFVFSTNKKN